MRTLSKSRLLAQSRQPVFEAGLMAAGAMAFADVMLPTTDRGKRAWRMVEVKSSTGVKDHCRLDTFGLVRLWQFFSGRRAALRVRH